MNRFIFNCFTFFALIIFVFNNAIANEGYKITGHYYVAEKNSPDKYNEKIQWDITNVGEWTKFLEEIKKLPQEKVKIHPMKQGQADIIHISQINPDQLSGNDMFISGAGIHQFARMPQDIYYSNAAAFKEFLNTELSLNPGYGEDTKAIDIHTPGIVVIYQGSSQLQNPTWLIKPEDKKVFEKYNEFIFGLKEPEKKDTVKLLMDDSAYEESGTFYLYLNYPEAPHDFIVIGTDGSARGTKVLDKYLFYKDTVGYYSVFKRQAEDNLKASLRIIETDPKDAEIIQMKKNDLF